MEVDLQDDPNAGYYDEDSDGGFGGEDSDGEQPEDFLTEEVRQTMQESDVFRRIETKNLGKASDGLAPSAFTKQVDTELQARVAELRSLYNKESVAEHYDADYFDSDDESSATGGKKAVVSNDDLLYDPNVDDDNETWMANYAKSRGSGVRTQEMTDDPFEDDADKVAARNKRMGLIAAPNSDAILNCPSCMNLLCLDCQQHSIYKTQFRAMFVMNCIVDRSTHETIGLTRKARNKARKGVMVPAELDDVKSFHNVECSECQTEVAKYDEDEIYHFYNVLASKP